MSLLSYNELCQLVEQGVIDAPMENVNGASIDITLGCEVLTEEYILEDGDFTRPTIDLAKKEALNLLSHKLWKDGDADGSLILYPGEFILASSQETFNLPNNVGAEYKLKSSLARCGLQHMLAGWCDPGWTNSKLTLELKNVTEAHSLRIRQGMKIGQMVFWKCNAVPEENSYAVKGQYNNQETVTNSKGVR